MKEIFLCLNQAKITVRMKAKLVALLGGIVAGLGVLFLVRTQFSHEPSKEPRLISMVLSQSWTPKEESKLKVEKTTSDRDEFPDVADTHWASETPLTNFQQLRIFYAIGNISQYRKLKFKEENPSADFVIGYKDANENPTVTRYQTIPLSALPPDVKQTVLNILKESNFKPLSDLKN